MSKPFRRGGQAAELARGAARTAAVASNRALEAAKDLREAVRAFDAVAHELGLAFIEASGHGTPSISDAMAEATDRASRSLAEAQMAGAAAARTAHATAVAAVRAGGDAISVAFQCVGDDDHEIWAAIAAAVAAHEVSRRTFEVASKAAEAANSANDADYHDRLQKVLAAIEALADSARASSEAAIKASEAAASACLAATMKK